MNSKEIVKQTLENWRFPVVQETENTIVLRYQMNYVQIGSLQEDSRAIAVTLTGFFNAEDAKEKSLALKACNELNYRMMQVKLYVDEDDDVVAASEFFYHDEDDVEFLLNLALKSVVMGKVRFQTQYEAAEEEYSLIQELDGEEETE